MLFLCMGKPRIRGAYVWEQNMLYHTCLAERDPVFLCRKHHKYSPGLAGRLLCLQNRPRGETDMLHAWGGAVLAWQVIVWL